MREIVLDTETTGLDPSRGDRIVEIGAIELINYIPSGKTFHTYINPERGMPPEAQAVHGLSTSFLKDKPVFAKVADDFLEFISDSMIIIHNASFDTGFLNAELSYLGKEPLRPDRIVDTLMLARQKHPMGPNSLDALCRRYGVDNSKRAKHGALLDSELLAEVYVELIGGRQTALSLTTAETKSVVRLPSAPIATTRPRSLRVRLTAAEHEAHAELISEFGDATIWKKLN